MRIATKEGHDTIFAYSRAAIKMNARQSRRLLCDSCSGVSKDCIMTLLRSYPHMSILESNEYSRISEYNLENR